MNRMKIDKIMSIQWHIGNHQFHTFHREQDVGVFVIMMLLTAFCNTLIYKWCWNALKNNFGTTNIYRFVYRMTNAEHLYSIRFSMINAWIKSICIDNYLGSSVSSMVITYISKWWILLQFYHICWHRLSQLLQLS